VIAALLLRKQRNERFSTSWRRYCLELAGDRLPIPCHRSWPPASEPLSFFHICGRNDYAHTWRVRASDRSVPELTAGERVNPVVGSSRISRSGSWMREQQSPSFAACRRQFFAGRSEKGRVRCSGAAGDPRVPLGTRLSEQAAKKLDVSRRSDPIKVFAESLRHIGDPRAD